MEAGVRLEGDGRSGPAGSHVVPASSKPEHSPGQTPRGSPFPENKGSAKPRPFGQKNRAKTPPQGQLFLKIQQRNTKQMMKNSTETLICLEILKQ